MWSHLQSKVAPDHTEDSHSEAHTLFRENAPGNAHHSVKPQHDNLPGIDKVSSTGVLYVTERATANGFHDLNPEWANFGQGAPEVGAIPGGSERPGLIDMSKMGANINEYSPTTGVKALREAVAKLYNLEYRVGKESQYTYENVCIVPGGRAGLTRVAATIGEVYVSYQVPEYTAYSEMLSSFRKLVPIPTVMSKEDAYHLNIDKLKKDIKEQGLSVVCMSNPRNPTGQSVSGKELAELVQMGRDGTTMILDEFYSWYQYELAEGETISAATEVEDVNADPVVIINGLTKCFRLPGWRVCWVLGPKQFITTLGQSGGFLDGGASHVLQVAAIPLLDYDRVQQDKIALQRHFKMKRDHVLKRLEKMGLKVNNPPTSTFYIWLDLSALPSPLNSGLTFFEECLKEKTIVVPGIFFDISPGHRRNLFDSPCNNFIRLSFGPALVELDRGLDGIERVLSRVNKHVEDGGDIHEIVGKGLKV